MDFEVTIMLMLVRICLKDEGLVRRRLRAAVDVGPGQAEALRFGALTRYKAGPGDGPASGASSAFPSSSFSRIRMSLGMWIVTYSPSSTCV